MQPSRITALVLVAALLTIGPATAGNGAGGPTGDAFPDFDGDGHGDLAIAVPGEDYGGSIDAGVVHVLYGSGDGTTTDGNQLLHAGNSGGAISSSEGFGWSLAFGDFDGDGRDDLAIGAGNHDAPWADNSGRVYVLYGGTSPDAPLGQGEAFDQDTAGVPTHVEAGDRFGATLTSGDYDGDGRDDLAIGVPEEGIDGRVDAGAVYVMWGTGSGLTPSDDTFLTEDTPGVVSKAVAHEYFAEALASGDVDGDGRDDLVAAAPFTTIDSHTGAGAIHVLFGAGSGFGLERDRIFHEDTPGVPDAAGDYEDFGSVLTTGDFDGDGDDEIAVGCPEENVGGLGDAGLVSEIAYRASGPALWSGSVWNQGSPGVQDVPSIGDRFGSAVAAGDFDGDGRVDLAIGVPHEREGFFADVGAVAVLYGTADGLGKAGDELVKQNTAGIGEPAESGDRFGRALRALDTDGDGRDDLMVGVPYESSDTEANIGRAHVLTGGSSGLLASGAAVGHRAFSQDAAGVPDETEPHDMLGW